VRAVSGDEGFGGVDYKATRSRAPHSEAQPATVRSSSGLSGEGPFSPFASEKRPELATNTSAFQSSCPESISPL